MINVIIPTYKPDKRFVELIGKLNSQTIVPDRIIVINTEEKYWDDSIKIDDSNVEVHHITKAEFDHGNTRNLGMSMADADICILMTMDAVPADNKLIEELIKPFDEQENVATSYARQLAHESSSYTEKLTREFNYPAESRIKSQADIEKLQIKAFFCSNVCCAYNKAVFDQLGGFVKKTIFNEDMLYASKALHAGYLIAYQAEAKVYHSHEYNGITQFRRNFDNGVSHAQYPEVFDEVTQEGEGFRMVKTVVGKLLKKGHTIEAVRYFWHTVCKYIGFKLGCAYKKLPKWMVLACTSDKSYFIEMK